MRCVISCFALLALSFYSASASASISVITAPPSLEPDRTIEAIAAAAPGDGASTTAAGFWNESVMDNASTVAGDVIVANASQTSNIPDVVGTAIMGAGSANISLDTTGAAEYIYRADSTFDVFFEVTAEQVYEFQGDVSWTGSLPEFGNGFTTVVLRDDTNNASIFFAEADEMDSGGAFDVFPTLSPGIVYQLKVRAHISGESSDAGEHFPFADFAFTLHPVVPEPATALQAMLGLLLGATSLRQRR